MSKTIFIAGISGRMGSAAAGLFKEAGWNVTGLDIKPEGCGCEDTFISADVRDPEAVAAAIEKVDSQTPIDAVFNAAGYELAKDFEAVTAEEWADLLDTTLGGAGNLCRAIGPKMAERKEGKIILFSSDYSSAEGDTVVDAVAAHTLHGFAKSFGVEMAPENVLVNVIFANTPLDAEKVSETVFFLADKDTYTSAQVVSIGGQDQ